MLDKPNILIVLTGPTAVGKTRLSLDLAHYYDSEIFSCDSRQFYKQMSIGTAKPNSTELNLVHHHFINTLDISEEYNAGAFERDCLNALDQYFTNNKIAILTGGSGLFIKAVCEGLDEFPKVSKKVIDDLNEVFEKYGVEHLQNELKLRDATYYELVDLNNPHRLIRALSVIKSSGKKFSDFLKKEKEPRSFNPIYIILNRDREELYERINLRVDSMISDGLIEEVKSLFPLRHFNALQTVGYQELFSHLEEKISLDEAVELIKRNSRRYAKRQLTWFRKIPNAHWFHPDEKEKIINLLNEKISGIQSSIP